MDGTNAPKSHHIEALERAVRVIELLAEDPAGLSLREITEGTGLAKTSAFRVLQTWEGLGYVQRTVSGRYQLGLAALRLARRLGRRNRLIEASRDLLLRLQRATGESVYLAVYRSGRVVLIDGVESIHPLRVVVDLGEQCYLHASAQGQAVAAFLDPMALAEHLKFAGLPKITVNTKTDPQILAGRLEEVRRRGYAINWEETVEGAVCLGTPYSAGAEGCVLGSIGLSIPVPRANESHVAHCVESLLQSSLDLSRVLVDVVPEPDARPAAKALAQLASHRMATAHQRKSSLSK